jgi:hypothetical protein
MRNLAARGLLGSQAAPPIQVQSADHRASGAGR